MVSGVARFPRGPRGAGRQTLSGAFSAYLEAFLQTFSCSLSFVKLLFHVASDVKYHIVVISKFGKFVVCGLFSRTRIIG